MPVPPPSEAYAEPDFVIVSDAAKNGWCCILIDMKGGQSTVVSGVWPPEFDEFSGISAESEPIALLAGIEHLFHSQACATMRISAITPKPLGSQQRATLRAAVT